MPKPYPPEFRRRALDLVASGRTVVEVAASLGISQAVLYHWKSRELVDAGVKPGRSSEDAKELPKATRRIRELEEEVAILRKAAAAVEEVVPPKGRYALVAELAAEGVSVERSCFFLGVSRSGYYEWKDRPPSTRAVRHAWLTDLITTVHASSNGVYGRRRVHAELVHGHGIEVGKRAVDLLMGRAGLVGLPKRKGLKRAPGLIAAGDLVGRRFARSGPNQLWVTDITEHPTREGKIYCCVVLDAWSRLVVGWSIDSSQTAALATNALGMAVDQRERAPGGIIHADHGTQFTSWAFTERARRAGLLPSTGKVGSAPRQRAGRSLLGPDADRAVGLKTLEHPDRARQRDLRVHRGLPQPKTPPLRPRLAHPARIRDHQPTPDRRIRLHTTAPGKPGTDQAVRKSVARSLPIGLVDQRGGSRCCDTGRDE